MTLKKWISANIRCGKLSDPKEEKPHAKIAGLFLTTFGTSYFAFTLLTGNKPGGDSIGIAFFITMSGIFFSFPELMKGGTKAMSTMRAMIFMMVNIICMLLLKTGWNKNSLAEIELNGYWITIIGILFAAKVVQSYFEAKVVVPKANTGSAKGIYSSLDYVNFAISQNQHYIYGKGNIRLVTPGKMRVGNSLVDCVSVHLKNENDGGLPDFLLASPPDASSRHVPLEIIRAVDKPRVSYHAGDWIANAQSSDFKGSIACKVKLKNGDECLVTCSHVMTNGSSFNYNGYFSNVFDSLITGAKTGKCFYALRDHEFDVALIRDFNPPGLNFHNGIKVTSCREVTAADIKQTQVTMLGRVDFYSTLPNTNAIDGFIINHKAINPITISYSDGDFALTNLMLLSKTADPPFEALSRPGDSGSLIIDSNNIAIGLVVAQNSKFTYAISLPKVMNKLLAQLV